MIRRLNKNELRQANGGRALLASTSIDLRFSERQDQEGPSVSDLASYSSVAILNNDTISSLSGFLGNDDVANVRRDVNFRGLHKSTDRRSRAHTFRSRFLKRE